MEIFYVLVYDGSIDFFVRFEQEFEEIHEACVQFHKITILVNNLFFDEQFQAVFVIFQQSQCIGISEAEYFSFLEHFRQQSSCCGDGIYYFVYRTEYVHNTYKKSSQSYSLARIFPNF